ncbi:hypothetical protein [Streptomyces sp. NPDC003393]
MTKDHKADWDRVSTQNSYADFARQVEEQPHGGGFLTRLVNGTLRTMVGATPSGQAVFGSTDFGNTQLGLNQLLDLIAQANPEDLESSGKALWDARDAIKAAAEELSGHIDHVHWVGESGDAFRNWGGDLVASAHALSEFAGGAGDQITAAATGLASVRAAMPARDSHPNRRRPEAFTAAEKAANKDDYDAAVRVEKDRQEAINQMNRLASYYAVSGQQLEAWQNKAPTFGTMPDVGVPKPSYSTVHDPGTGGGTRPDSDDRVSSPAGVVRHHATVEPTRPVGPIPGGEVQPPATDIRQDITTPVGTSIDSVGTLPPPSPTTPTPPAPPVTGAPPAGGNVTPFAGDFGTPVSKGLSTKGPGGTAGLRGPASGQGRAGTPGRTESGSGRATARGTMSQMGRATGAGGQATKGSPTSSKPSITGRGITGGSPRTGGGTTPRTGGAPNTGAARSRGVIGGRPTAAGASVKSGPRVPRGTVIGAEESAGSRTSPARPGPGRGTGGTGSVGRPASPAVDSRAAGDAPEGVNARPTAQNSLARAERNGMTRGGSGLVRGPGSRGKADGGGAARGSRRPDRSVEDEESPAPTEPRRDVPPTAN